MAASGRPATSVVAARGAAGQPFDLAADWTRLSRMHEVWLTEMTDGRQRLPGMEPQTDVQRAQKYTRYNCSFICFFFLIDLWIYLLFVWVFYPSSKTYSSYVINVNRRSGEMVAIWVVRCIKPSEFYHFFWCLTHLQSFNCHSFISSSYNIFINHVAKHWPSQFIQPSKDGLELWIWEKQGKKKKKPCCDVASRSNKSNMKFINSAPSPVTSPQSTSVSANLHAAKSKIHALNGQSISH